MNYLEFTSSPIAPLVVNISSVLLDAIVLKAWKGFAGHVLLSLNVKWSLRSVTVKIKNGRAYAVRG